MAARPSNSAQRRAQITSALLQVMATNGYEAASVASIAEAAGLAPGLVHYHFKNKQEILLELLETIVARGRERLEVRLTAAAGDPRAQLAVYLDSHLGLGSDHDPQALACWIAASGEALRQPEVRASYAAALQGLSARLQTIVAEGVSQGCFDCADPAAAAGALLALIQGYYVLAATARPLIPHGSAAGAAHRMAAGLLRTPDLRPERRLTP